MAKRTEREELLSYISDAHKDAYGFRPRGIYNELTIEQLRVEADRLSEAVADAIREQEAAQAAAAVIFEARIATLIEMGAGDRATAIRWDKQSYEDDYILEDESYYEYKNGLQYGYFRRQAEEVAA